MKELIYKNDDLMPIIGLGTWESAPGEVSKAVLEAIKIGYRHIDCASIYGNEKEIGIGIREAIDSKIVEREDLWITSKLWNNSHGKENVIPALKQTLSDLQTDYLDLYLVHWPIAFKNEIINAKKADDFLSLEQQPISDTWQGMEEAVNLRLAHHIGVSNFSIKKLKSLIENSKIHPEMNQVEMHPYLQQRELVDYCHQNNIHVTGYSPLGRPKASKSKNESILLENEVINKISQKHNCSAAQVMLAWAMERNTAVIPKSVNPERLQENLDSSEIYLSNDDMNEITALNNNHRYIDGTFWVVENGPYTLKNLWD